MKRIGIFCLAALFPLGADFRASAASTPTTVFKCSIGGKTVSVTSAGGGRLTYHYGTAGKDELSIVGIPGSGNIFRMWQRFAGIERQLRFKNGEFSYIVYDNEGNDRVGAAASSGLVVMRGTTRISDRQCSPFAEIAMPEDASDIPEDTDPYSAM